MGKWQLSYMAKFEALECAIAVNTGLLTLCSLSSESGGEGNDFRGVITRGDVRASRCARAAMGLVK
jgi:hypothetical protein